MDNTNHEFFAPCPRGLEAILADEFTELGASSVRPTAGGVAFSGTLALCYRANLQSRIASRILMRVAESPYRDEENVYEVAKAVRWQDWFTPERTIKVKVSAHHCPLKSLDFVTLRIKDAVCDRFQYARGKRPVVDTHTPDILIAAFLSSSTCTLYLDTSGDPLFKRGWRKSAGEAPIRENLAAGILRLAKWSSETALLDPMCGSGTFVVEAALMARRIAPGSGRGFAFERLLSFDAGLFDDLRAEVLAEERPAPSGLIHAADRSAHALASVKANLAATGSGGAVTLHHGDVLEMRAPVESGILVTNPPYGHRMGHGEELRAFYPKLGDQLKKHYAGWSVHILTADLKLPGLLRLAPSRRTPLFNGAIECRLFEFRMVAGSLRKPRSQQEAAGTIPSHPRHRA